MGRPNAEVAAGAKDDPWRELWRQKPLAAQAMMAGVAGGARTPACRVGTLADTQHFCNPEASARVPTRHRGVRAPRRSPVSPTVCREVCGECRRCKHKYLRHLGPPVFPRTCGGVCGESATSSIGPLSGPAKDRLSLVPTHPEYEQFTSGVRPATCNPGDRGVGRTGRLHKNRDRVGQPVTLSARLTEPHASLSRCHAARAYPDLRRYSM